jgi:hypothetical protein
MFKIEQYTRKSKIYSVWNGKYDTYPIIDIGLFDKVAVYSSPLPCAVLKGTDWDMFKQASFDVARATDIEVFGEILLITKEKTV